MPSSEIEDTFILVQIYVWNGNDGSEFLRKSPVSRFETLGVNDRFQFTFLKLSRH